MNITHRDIKLDNIIYNNKQVYKKNYFDLVESEWLKNGVIFRSLDEGLTKQGIDPTRLLLFAKRSSKSVSSFMEDGSKPVKSL